MNTGGAPSFTSFQFLRLLQHAAHIARLTWAAGYGRHTTSEAFIQSQIAAWAL